jgi:hypothetical protein
MFFRRGIVSAAAFGALLFAMLAPGAASAHPGHGHSLVEKVATTKTPAAPRMASKAASRETVVRQAVPVRAGAAGLLHPGCGDPNCCGDGHCLSFAGVIAPLATAEFLDHLGFLPAGFNVPPPRSRVTEGPPRPPKSFA